MIEAIIPSGATGLSGEIDLAGNILVAIQMPATWVSASLTFQASLDGGNTYGNVFQDDGTEFTLLAVAGIVIVIRTPAEWWHGAKIKIRSGTSGRSDRGQNSEARYANGVSVTGGAGTINKRGDR